MFDIRQFYIRKNTYFVCDILIISRQQSTVLVSSIGETHLAGVPSNFKTILRRTKIDFFSSLPKLMEVLYTTLSARHSLTIQQLQTGLLQLLALDMLSSYVVILWFIFLLNKKILSLKKKKTSLTG